MNKTLGEQVDNRNRTRATRILLAIMVVSLILRVALLRIDRVVRWDEPDYLMLGRNLFSGRGYAVADRPELHYAPLFPIVTGLLYPLTRDMKLNSDISYVLFGTLTLLPVFGIAQRLWGLRIAVISTALVCLFPMLTAAVPFWGTMLEPLYLFLLFAALYCGWVAWEDHGLAAHLAAGALLGLAYLTKPEAVVYFGLMVLLLVLGNLWRRTFSKRGPVLGILGVVLAFVLVISPYITFLYRHTGRIMISGKLGVTYVAGQGAVEHDPTLYDRALSQLDEAGEEIIWFSMDRFKYSIWDIISDDPRGFVLRTWRNINRLEELLFSRQAFPFYLLLFVGLGWFGSAWGRERAANELFLVAAALPVLTFMPFHIELRYFAPMLPILLIWVAKGIDALAQWAKETAVSLGFPTRWQRGLCYAALVIPSATLLLYFALMHPQVVQEGLAGMGTSRREAGLWLKRNSPIDAMVMSRDTEVPFYAERRWAATPHEDYPRFIAYVRKRGADYLVVDQREVTVVRPQLRLLLDEDTPPPELLHAYTAYDSSGKTIVYKVIH